MIRDISALTSKRFDLLVIGGGINGAAIANEAAGRGLSVALLEKGDFASGASSKTTKIIHGGIRYLENLEFDLVIESLRERHILLTTVPNLVKPLGFVISVYEEDPRPLWLIRLGVSLYDSLAGTYLIKRHKNLSAEELSQIEPWIKKEGLKGGTLYYDAQMDDARLCLENILSAADKGAAVANYTEVVSFLKEQGVSVGVRVKDVLTGRLFEVWAKNIISAAGPWTDILLKMDNPKAKPLVRTTKGVHIIYPGRLSNNALLISSHTDRRIFFIIPWMGNTLIGTTDTDYTDSPDEVRAEDSDIDYLSRETRRVFPDIEFKKENIITTYAGLRPLVQGAGAPSSVSRKHIIFKSASGVVFVAGGKYTIYRRLANDAINCILKERQKPHIYSLHCGDIIKEGLRDAAIIRELSKDYGIDQEIIIFLIDRYGVRYKDVLALTDKDASLKERLCPGLPFIKAEVIHSARREMAVTVEDIFLRRLPLDYCRCNKMACRIMIEQMLSNEPRYA